MAVGRAKAHINPLLGALGTEVVRPGVAQKNLDYQQRFSLDRNHLDARNQARTDGIVDQVAQALLFVEWMFQSKGLSRCVFHANDHPTTGRIGKRNQSF